MLGYSIHQDTPLLMFHPSILSGGGGERKGYSKTQVTGVLAYLYVCELLEEPLGYLST